MGIFINVVDSVVLLTFWWNEYILRCDSAESSVKNSEKVNMVPKIRLLAVAKKTCNTSLNYFHNLIYGVLMLKYMVCSC